MAVLLETSLGDVVVDLYTAERPKTSLNFLKLCKMKYYNYSLFYNVQKGFIAQAGDPTGKGKGGQCVWGVIAGEQAQFFEAETVPRLKHTKLGTISMVNNGQGYHGSQFFLTLNANLDYLDKDHTVFGEVAEGFDVLQKINQVHVDKEGCPFQDIRIYHTVILDDPFDDLPHMVLPDRSPSPPKQIFDSDRIGAEEKIDEFEGMTEEEVKAVIRQRESKANADILEMIGDIPDADGRPPENVLFVCKLNSVTTAEDLEIIFSRFGPIVSCDIIRDQKTGDSLQYGFIDFEKEEDCVNAYFKMDNVLIDDRRIHVDFCQSLAKVKHGKNRRISNSDTKIMPKEHNAQGYDMIFDDAELVQHSKKNHGGQWNGSGSKDRQRYSFSKKTDSKKRSRSRSAERKVRHCFRSTERCNRHSAESRERHGRHRSRSTERHGRHRSRSTERHGRHRSRSTERHGRHRSRSADRQGRHSSERYHKHSRSSTHGSHSGERSRYRL